MIRVVMFVVLSVAFAQVCRAEVMICVKVSTTTCAAECPGHSSQYCSGGSVCENAPIVGKQCPGNQTEIRLLSEWNANRNKAVAVSENEQGNNWSLQTWQCVASQACECNWDPSRGEYICMLGGADTQVALCYFSRAKNPGSKCFGDVINPL